MASVLSTDYVLKFILVVERNINTRGVTIMYLQVIVLETLVSRIVR